MSVRAIIAVLLVLAFIGLLLLLAYQGKTETPTFNLLVGALTGAALGHVIGYYFGTTESSALKDDTINLAVSQDSQLPPSVPVRAPALVPPLVSPPAHPAQGA